MRVRLRARFEAMGGRIAIDDDVADIARGGTGPRSIRKAGTTWAAAGFAILALTDGAGRWASIAKPPNRPVTRIKRLHSANFLMSAPA